MPFPLFCSNIYMHLEGEFLMEKYNMYFAMQTANKINTTSVTWREFLIGF